MLVQTSKQNSLFFDDPLWWLVGTILICIGLTISIFLHELGHWIMAKLCGYRPLAFSVGEGRVMWRKESPSAFWSIQLLPISGHIIAIKTAGTERGWQSFLLSFGGPLFTCFAVGLCWMGWAASKSWVGSEFVAVLGQSCAVLCVLEMLSLGYNLWPHYSTMEDRIIPNDGMSMLLSLTNKNYPKPDYTSAVLQQALGSEVPVSVSEEARRLHLEILRAEVAGRHQDARRLWEELVDHPETCNTAREGWLAHISGTGLLQWNDKESLNFALESAKTLAEMQPANTSYRLWLGALQIEGGELLEGRLLLQPLLKDSPDAEKQSFILAYLGLADHRQHNHPAAREKYEQARRVNPWSPAVARLGAALEGRTNRENPW